MVTLDLHALFRKSKHLVLPHEVSVRCKFFNRCPFSGRGRFLLFLDLLRGFICFFFVFNEWVLGFVKCFCVLRLSYTFPFLFCYYTIDLQMLNQPYIPGINLSWLHCWIWLLIFIEDFCVFAVMSDVGMQVFFMMSLSGFVLG